jgi:hypothetical protein
MKIYNTLLKIFLNFVIIISALSVGLQLLKDGTPEYTKMCFDLLVIILCDNTLTKIDSENKNI